jgi:hypothetical protein
VKWKADAKRYDPIASDSERSHEKSVKTAEEEEGGKKGKKEF